MISNIFIGFLNLLLAIGMAWERSNEEFINELRGIQRGLVVSSLLIILMLVLNIAIGGLLGNSYETIKIFFSYFIVPPIASFVWFSFRYLRFFEII